MILLGVDLLLQVFFLRRSGGGRRELGQIRNLPAQESDLVVECFAIAIGPAGGLHSNESSSPPSGLQRQDARAASLFHHLQIVQGHRLLAPSKPSG